MIDRLYKRRLTEHEEFELMKIVLDKFLWLGIIFAGFGLYRLLTGETGQGVIFILVGFVLMILFAWIIKKEFEQLR